MIMTKVEGINEKKMVDWWVIAEQCTESRVRTGLVISGNGKMGNVCR